MLWNLDHLVYRKPTVVDKTRILILDDHTILREGIARLLNLEHDLVVNGSSGSVGEALLLVGAGFADLVLLDIDLGKERGTDFLIQVRRNGFHGPVLVLTAGIPEDERRLLESLGVSAILTKNVAVSQLANHIRAATGQETRDVRQTSEASSTAKQPVGFTARQAKTLRLVVAGLSNKQTAVELDTSEAIVKSVLQQLFRKTGTHNRAQLVRVALEQLRGEW
jgi:DNA-binding NarL/FixJ family response regulator